MRLNLTERLLLVLLPLLAVAGWVSMLSAQLGRWAPNLSMAAGVAAAVAVVLARRRVVAVSREHPSSGDRHDGPPVNRSQRTILLDLLPILAMLLLVARLWPAVTPWPTYLDASWYVNTAALIEREAALRFHPAALALPPDTRRPLVATFADEAEAGVSRMPPEEHYGFYDVVFAVADDPRGATASVTPYHPPFFAAYLALAARVLGRGRIGDGVLPWSLAYLLAAAALAHALARSRVAPMVAVLILGVGPGFAYYGRQPFAEMAAGACLMAGLWAGVNVARSATPAPLWASLYGLGLGLAALAKIDVLPATVVGLVWWALVRRRAGGRAELAALAAGAGLPLAQLAWLAAGVTRPYFALNGGGVTALAAKHAGQLAFLTAVTLVFAVMAAARWRQRSAHPARTWRADARPPAVSPPAVRIVGRLVLAAYALGLLGVLARAMLRPADLPPGMADLLLWLLSPLGVAGALVGLWWLGQDGSGSASASPVLAQVMVSLPAVLAAPLVSESLSSLYAARRLLPLAMPLAAVGAALAVAWVINRTRLPSESPSAMASSRDPAPSPAAGDGLGSAWPSPSLVPNLGRHGGLAVGVAALVLGLAALVRAAAPLAALNEFDGGPRLVSRLASYGGPDDRWLFGAPLAGVRVGRLAAPMWSLAGREAAALGPNAVDGAAFEATARALARPGRRLFLVTDDAHVPEDLPPRTLSYLGEESIVTTVVLPSPGLPPRVGPLEIKALVFALDFGP